MFQMHESFKILSSILTVERGIKKLPIFFFRTGYHFSCKYFLKRGLHLKACRHTPTQNLLGYPPGFCCISIAAKKCQIC